MRHALRRLIAGPISAFGLTLAVPQFAVARGRRWKGLAEMVGSREWCFSPTFIGVYGEFVRKAR